MEKVTRRAFIGGMGAILATGAVAMSGCVRTVRLSGDCSTLRR